MKDKERLRNYDRLEETKEAWQLYTMEDLGTEKKISGNTGKNSIQFEDYFIIVLSMLISAFNSYFMIM